MLMEKRGEAVMRAIAVLLGALLAQPLAAQTADGLGWMVGDWVEVKEGKLTEEVWMAPRGGMLLGMSRSGKAGTAGAFEFVRIGPGADGRLAFHAQPNGAPPAAFAATEQTGQSILFENRAHDYPQRIRYWREGDRLMAEISLADGSKPVRWQFAPRR
jgi:hypothetical protein